MSGRIGSATYAANGIVSTGLVTLFICSIARLKGDKPRSRCLLDLSSDTPGEKGSAGEECQARHRYTLGERETRTARIKVENS